MKNAERKQAAVVHVKTEKVVLHSCSASIAGAEYADWARGHVGPMQGVDRYLRLFGWN